VTASRREDKDMTTVLVLLAFVAVVGVLAALNSGRTRGRGCCAPADPIADLRMRDPQER
jgi:hypothetical protein